MSGTEASLGSHRLTLEQLPLRDDTPATWGDSVANWKQYLREKAEEYLVFVGKGRDNEGEIATAPYSHRFQQEYTKMQYAKIQDFIRGALSEYDDPHLAILTLSTTTTTPTGEPRPPLDHLEELLDPWGDGVYYELNRVLSDPRQIDPYDPDDDRLRFDPREEWEYLQILEPTTDEGMVPGGYAHPHIALVVDGEVSPERFEPVIDRHITECPGALGQAHEMDDAIEVKRAEELGNPGAYLFKYLGKSWDVEEMADYEERFAALLFEEGRQRFRASNGAQRWMQRDEEESESGDWIFAGIANEELVDQLDEFEDYEDFLIATDASGLRSWLGRRRGPGVDRDVVEEKKERQQAGMTEREVAARVKAGIPMPWEGVRPPPNREL